MSDYTADPGEQDRESQGIDGTAGDAQDIDHYYVSSVAGYCTLCGLAKTYKRHKDRYDGGMT